MVSGERILCSSVAFGNHLLVEVQKLGSDARTPARVVLTDPEGPLALVEVDDPGFWEDLEPLPLADQLPREGDVRANLAFARKSTADAIEPQQSEAILRT